MPKMKTFRVKLYPEKYDMVMESIRMNGYKKTEYLLACVSAAKKNSMEATYRKYTEEHKARRTAERNAARLAQEEEFTARKNRIRND